MEEMLKNSKKGKGFLHNYSNQSSQRKMVEGMHRRGMRFQPMGELCADSKRSKEDIGSS